MTDQEPYGIEALLNSGRQPMKDLGKEEFAGLRKALGKRPLADPVSLSSDGLLLDGHQRLRAQLANGRTEIGADEVRIIAEANAGNAFEWAVRLNVQRRHLTVEDKAELARMLQAERRWSQGKIAQLFGVSRPAVSQWLSKTAADDAGPVMVEGTDGKAYPVEPPPRREPKMTPAWAPSGLGYRSLQSALTRLQTEPYAPLDPLKRAKLVDMLTSASEAIDKLMDVIARDADRHPEGEGEPDD
jgi:DNA-binding transcriptional regulator YdaS (Cro superfamily)